MKNIVIIAIISLCSLILAAPGLAADANSTQNQPQTIKIPKSITKSNEVAVTVNDKVILESEIEKEMQQEIQREMQRLKGLPPAFADQIKENLIANVRAKYLDVLIVEHLLDQKVKNENIRITDEEVLAQLEQMGADQDPPWTVEQIKNFVESQGQSFEKTKNRIRRGLGYQKLIDDRTGDLNITEEDAKKYYEENIDLFKQTEQVKASHILISLDTSDPNTDPNDAKAKAMDKAEDILKQLKAGADFAALAMEHSDCPSGKGGGDLGFGNKSNPEEGVRGSWVPPFEKAAFALQPGQISGIVETQFGYHIIKVTERKEARTIPFDEVKDDIIQKLKFDKKEKVAKDLIEDLKSKADIDYPPGKRPKPQPGPPGAPTQ